MKIFTKASNLKIMIVNQDPRHYVLINTLYDTIIIKLNELSTIDAQQPCKATVSSLPLQWKPSHILKQDQRHEDEARKTWAPINR